MVMQKGRAVHSTLFLLRVVDSPDPGSKSVISAVAPSKIAKTAVLRNSTRRKMYEAIKDHVPLFKHGQLAVILAKQTALTVSVQEMKTDMKPLFVKAGLLK